MTGTPGIYLYTSNRLEVLAREAARVLREGPASSPFNREVFMVQTEGMKRWLSLRMADHNGIFSNGLFISPAELLSMIERDVISASNAGSPFERNAFPWTIMKLLDETAGKDRDLSIVTDYAAGNALKLFQVASKIADMFDQYAIYRPQMLQAWESGKLYYESPHELWQRKIWLALKERHGSRYPNRYASLMSCLRALESPDAAARNRLPRRLLVFGISVLPDFYISLLRGLSAHTAVHLFLMNPSRYYWGDIRSDRELARLRMKLKNRDTTLEEYHYEKGNTILASMGKSGRDFFSSIYSGGDMDAAEESFFDEPQGETLLMRIQGDILNLTEKSAEAREKISLAPHDASVRIASCHSAMREVEVLHDYLLSLFDEDGTLMPSHVLILTPDINAYAPYIDAVFGTAGENVRFPYSIADRSISSANRIAGLFLGLCDLAVSRLEASKVLTFLGAEPVRDHFGLDLAALDQLQQWVADTGIRWGADGAFRERLGLPGYEENTWIAGLDRMILGYAMAGGGETFFHDVLPFDRIEGTLAGVLGKFMTFMARVLDLVEGVGKARSLSAWRLFFIDMLDSFFMATDEKENEFRYIRNQLDLLETVEKTTGFSEPVDFAVMKHFFTERFDSEMTSRGFITGGLTFSSMVPLRSIPFRVICLVGMNDEAFPRRTRPPGFDLMALSPMPGDRNTRESDRYLFLETLLSARERIYISYEGRSIRDNSEMLPSNLVVELLDYIEKNFISSNPGGIRDRIVVEHPLQSFSPRYFAGGDERLFSFRQDNCDAAKRLSAQGKPGRNFYRYRIPLPDLTEEFGDMGVEELIRFLKNTSAHFLGRRLHVDMAPAQAQYDDREMFVLDRLPRYMLSDDLLKHFLIDGEDRGLMEIYRAKGLLPHGTAGQLDYERLSARILDFSTRITSTVAGRESRQRVLSIPFGDVILSAAVKNLYDDEQILFRPSGLKPKDRLRLWIYHLFLCSAGSSVKSTFISFDTKLSMEPVEDAADILRGIIDLFREGLGRCVPFFPVSSWAYYEGLFQGRDPGHASALKKARGKWNDGFETGGERESDPYVELCFGGMDIQDMTDDFVNCARTVFRDYNLHAREEAVND